ncbi:MAG: hypothetical protein ABR909_04930 [Candidatus Bathyarchaeia archaeon]|jgi:hypothetical protein
MNGLSLKYNFDFKASDQPSTDGDLIIEGICIDSTTNANKWAVPKEDLPFLIQSLLDSKIRVDHSEKVLDIVGTIPEARMQGDDKVWFKGKIGDPAIKDRIKKGYLDSVSMQVDSQNVTCSGCGQPSRIDGKLSHLCEGAHEIVHNPVCRELSIVASPAYKDAKFRIASGFASAMNASQNINSLANWKAKKYLQIKILGALVTAQKLQETEEKAKVTAKIDLLQKIGNLQTKLSHTKKLNANAVLAAAQKEIEANTQFINELNRAFTKQPQQESNGLFAKSDCEAQKDFEIATEIDIIEHGNQGMGSLMNPIVFNEVKNLQSPQKPVKEES